MINKEVKPRGEKSVKDWIQFSVIVTGAILAVYALLWKEPPKNGLILISFLIFISFPFFANTVSANSKVNKYINSEPRKPQNHIDRMMNYAEFSFGFGFTLVISAFAILGYEFLKDYTALYPQLQFWALILPIVFLITVWILCIGYSLADSTKSSEAKETENQKRQLTEENSKGGKGSKNYERLKKLKRPVYISLELVFLILIILDYFNIIPII